MGLNPAILPSMEPVVVVEMMPPAILTPIKIQPISNNLSVKMDLKAKRIRGKCRANKRRESNDSISTISTCFSPGHLVLTTTQTQRMLEITNGSIEPDSKTEPVTGKRPLRHATITRRGKDLLNMDTTVVKTALELNAPPKRGVKKRLDKGVVRLVKQARKSLAVMPSDWSLKQCPIVQISGRAATVTAIPLAIDVKASPKILSSEGGATHDSGLSSLPVVVTVQPEPGVAPLSLLPTKSPGMTNVLNTLYRALREALMARSGCVRLTNDTSLSNEDPLLHGSKLQRTTPGPMINTKTSSQVVRKPDTVDRLTFNDCNVNLGVDIGNSISTGTENVGYMGNSIRSRLRNKTSDPVINIESHKNNNGGIGKRSNRNRRRPDDPLLRNSKHFIQSQLPPPTPKPLGNETWAQVAAVCPCMPGSPYGPKRKVLGSRRPVLPNLSTKLLGKTLKSLPQRETIVGLAPNAKSRGRKRKKVDHQLPTSHENIIQPEMNAEMELINDIDPAALGLASPELLGVGDKVTNMVSYGPVAVNKINSALEHRMKRAIEKGLICCATSGEWTMYPSEEGAGTQSRPKKKKINHSLSPKTSGNNQVIKAQTKRKRAQKMVDNLVDLLEVPDNDDECSQLGSENESDSESFTEHLSFSSSNNS